MKKFVRTIWRATVFGAKDMWGWIRNGWRAVTLAAIVAVIVGCAVWVFWASIFSPDWALRIKAVPPATGTFLGPLLGLLAILFGALLNADLNRQRDADLREQNARSLANALRAELIASAEMLELATEVMGYAVEGNEEALRRFPPIVDALELWTPSFSVYNANLSRLGVLGQDHDYELVRRINEARRTMAILLKSDLDLETFVEFRPRLVSRAYYLRVVADMLRKRAGLPEDTNFSIVHGIPTIDDFLGERITRPEH